MERYLPIKSDAIIKSRQSNALQLSVIQANLAEEDFLSWLCGEFINVVCDANAPLKFDFLREDFWFTGQGLTTKQQIFFKNSVLDFISFDSVKYICEMIDNGSYIMGDFNAFYIGEKAEYNILHKNSDYLIYGYDDAAETFSMLGNTRESVYTEFKVIFEEYLHSIGDREDKFFNLNIITVNKDKEYKISLPTVYRKLKDYINSECSDVQRYPSAVIYGIDAWTRFGREIKSRVGIYDYMDYRYFAVLAEHKRIMEHRIEHLVNENVLPDEEFLKQCRKVYRMAVEAVEICEAYNKRRDFSQIGVLDRILGEIVDTEKSYIPVVLEEIEKAYSSGISASEQNNIT